MVCVLWWVYGLCRVWFALGGDLGRFRFGDTATLVFVWCRLWCVQVWLGLGWVSRLVLGFVLWSGLRYVLV